MTTLLHGTRAGFVAAIEQRGLFRPMSAAFVLGEETDPLTLEFTLAVATFHAVGLWGWQSLARGDGLEDDRVLLMMAFDGLSELPATTMTRYEALDGSRRSAGYVRVAEIGPIRIRPDSIRRYTLPATAITARVAAASKGPIECERFFWNPERGTRVFTEVDTRPICVELARAAQTAFARGEAA